MHTDTDTDTAQLHKNIKEGAELCGRFTLESRIGQPGRTAQAFRAVDKLTKEAVVCKIAGVETARDNVLAEYHKLRSARSLGICDALGYFEHEEQPRKWPFLVLELVEGLTIDRWGQGKTNREKLDAALRATNALASLHKVGLPHGDLHNGNIIVTNDRVVLIDPDADEFGPVWEGRPQGAPASFAEDLYRLSELLSSFLQDLGSTAVVALIQALRGPAGQRPPATEVASILDSLLRTRIPIGDVAKDLKERHENDRHLREEQYREVRLFRDLSWKLLTDSLQVRASALGCKLETYDNEAALRAQSQPGLRGTLSERSIVCSSADGDSWHISLEESTGFRKPWPHDTPNLIARGRTNISINSTTVLNEDIEIVTLNKQPTLVRRGVDGVRRLANQAWLERCFELLLGTTISALDAPMQVGLPKKPISEHPLTLGLDETGDLSLIENSFVLASGVRAFMQMLKLFLETPQGTVEKDRRYGSTLHQALAAGDKKAREIIRHVATHEIPQAFGEYIDTIIFFDVTIDGAAQRMKISTEIQPHGSDTISFSFDVEFK